MRPDRGSLKSLNSTEHDSTMIFEHDIDTFLVSSDSREDLWHLLDLHGESGLPECSCESFEITLLKTHKTIICPHVRRVIRARAKDPSLELAPIA